MKSREAKWILVTLVASCALCAIALKVARATPPIGVVKTLIAGPIRYDEFDGRFITPQWKATMKTQGVDDQTDGISDVYIMDVKIAPGGDTGWHSHPGLIFTSVKSGTATEYHGDDCSPTVHLAGTGFTETGGQVHLVRNEGQTELDLVVFFLVPAGAPNRIDEPVPAGCGVL